MKRTDPGCESNHFGLLFIPEVSIWIAQCLDCGTYYRLGDDGELHRIDLDSRKPWAEQFTVKGTT